MSAEKITTEWKAGNFKPVYWLEGEEPYFIDRIMDHAEHNILNESEAGFNLTIFYGKDAEWTSVINACRRYPMFAERQVVLLKEAQHMKDIQKLESYIANPLSSTVFVVAYKDKKVDGRTGFAKVIKKNGELLQTRKLYENQLPEWVSDMVRSLGLQITSKALHLLIDNIGNDLNRLENEVKKVCINLGDAKNIDENAIEKFVGISKEFNAFEMQAALSRKDFAKAIRIIQYFEANPKAVPIQMLLPTLYSYFSKVYSIFSISDKSINNIKSVFNNFYTAQDGLDAAKNYGIQGIEKILLLLHEYNLRSIGINSSSKPDADLLKEMVVKMVS